MSELVAFVRARLDDDEAKASVHEQRGERVPAQRLRNLSDARRRTLDKHALLGGRCPQTMQPDCRTVRALASVWADHPDWRKEWDQ